MVLVEQEAQALLESLVPHQVWSRPRSLTPSPKVTVLQQYVTPQVAAGVIYIIDF